MKTYTTRTGGTCIPNATITLLPMDCQEDLRETMRTVRHLTPVGGIEIGTFEYLGKTRYAIHGEGSYVWYEVPCHFPAVRAIKQP